MRASITHISSPMSSTACKRTLFPSTLNSRIKSHRNTFTNIYSLVCNHFNRSRSTTNYSLDQGDKFVYNKKSKHLFSFGEFHRSKYSGRFNHCRHFCIGSNTDYQVKENKKLLIGKRDNYNGLWVDLSKTENAGLWNNELTDQHFDSILSSSLDKWRNETVSSVWLKVPIHLSHLITTASHYGFEFHHAEGRMAVLCLWMDNSCASKIPPFASHQIGVSGVVVNEETREVLVVKDKHKKYNVWKFPGGLSDLGEDIAQTAVREVFEETGVHTEFQSILAFRQQHNQASAFGRSDIYILCRLKPLSFELTPCEEEIEAVQWMNLDDLSQHEQTSAFSRHMTRLITHGMEHGFHTVDIVPNTTKSVFKTDMQLFHRPFNYR